MRRIFAAGALFLLVAAGVGFALGLKPSGPSQEQIEAGVAQTWNVQEVASSSWEDDKLMMLVTWKDLTKASSAAEQLCLTFPLSSVHWDNNLGEPRSYSCN